MKEYVVEGRKCVVIGEELYVQATVEKPRSTELDVPDSVATSKPEKLRRGRPREPGVMTMTEAVKRAKTYKPRRFLGPDARDTVIQDIRENDLGMVECCRKYKISVATYYNLKQQALSGRVKETIN